MIQTLRVVGFPFLVCSFGAAVAAQDPVAVDAARRSAVVERIGALLSERYVFAERGAECAAKLSSRLAEGAYDGADRRDAFARLLTEDLQQVTSDKHLRVRARRAPPAAGGGGSSAPAHGVTRVEVLEGNVGYLELRHFAPAERSGDAVAGAMAVLAGCDALIVDLRRNHGGSPTTIQLLCSYFFAEPTHLNSFFWRGQEQVDQFWTFAHVPGKRMPDAPIYVLTSGETFSAAEEFTYDLQQLGRATIVGETTGGGAHPGGLRAIDDAFEIWIPQGRAINPVSGGNWEGTGVVPDVAVPAEQALEAALGRARAGADLRGASAYAAAVAAARSGDHERALTLLASALGDREGGGEGDGQGDGDGDSEDDGRGERARALARDGDAATVQRALLDPAFAGELRERAAFRDLLHRAAVRHRVHELQLAPDGEPGEWIEVRGRTVTTDGAAIAGATVRVFATDAAGRYHPERDDERTPRLFGTLVSDADGHFIVRTVRPGPYPGTRNPRHLHIAANEGARRLAAPGYVVFDDDPLLFEPGNEEPRGEALRIHMQGPTGNLTLPLR